ncbi:AraC family transcriptional regulator [Chitinophagaceae bacterium LB-8]|uniref:AraC family transcriptional regulator n=1 Tax=Paraflavisolibacter caeni TaxID=2982496 RepID=A0A9X3BGQ0_9BACT|nr:helix-turn-helix transcriptional regulator [Paraflavisolibacter caeni]MCU7548152.1 AraC family transcriptional regulator [Paraflavisolibacter caeni]
MKTIPVRHITSAQREQSNAGRFSIRDVQQVLIGKDLVHDLHKHDFFFVLALHKGTGIHEIDFMQYEVHNNSIFILRPGQVHRLELMADSTGFLMEFDLSFYQPKNTITDQRWKKASSKNYCEVEASRFMKLHAILTSVFNEFTTKQEGYVEAIKANLDLFFIEYIRQSRNPKSIAKTESGYTQERFEELIRLLEVNIGSMKNVSQYADLLSLSSYQLNAITKASVGKTVSDLINEQIILEAKRYLLATSNQVKDVADHLGYEDVSYFIRFFKKHTGHSPDAFRKQYN